MLYRGPAVDGQLGEPGWASKEVNQRKADRLPHEAGLKLLSHPRAPKEYARFRPLSAIQDSLRTGTFSLAEKINPAVLLDTAGSDRSENSAIPKRIRQGIRRPSGANKPRFLCHWLRPKRPLLKALD